jgi:hypothetical protein
MADSMTLAGGVTAIGPINLSRLAAPFPPEQISWRVGATNGDKTKGLALAYIDARDVMRRLDDVVGPSGWQSEFIETPKGRVICRIGIDCGGRWVWKSDGAGDSDVEAEKGAISDALKRAAVHWGIGRYLYDMPATWVQIEQRGKTSVISDHEYQRLARVAGAAGGERPTPANPQPRPQPPPIRPAAERFIAKAKSELEGCAGDIDALHAMMDDIESREGWPKLNEVEQAAVTDEHKRLVKEAMP